MTNATLLDTSFDVFGLLEEQCDVPPSFAFEDAYGSIQSLLFIALVTIPALAGADNVSFFFVWLRARLFGPPNEAEQKPPGQSGRSESLETLQTKKVRKGRLQ